MLLMQDYFDDFFKGSSAADRGTLCQVKNMFNYRQVKADISENFAHSWELMCLITETFACLLTMDIQGFTDHTSRPATVPDGLEDEADEVKSAFFNNICEEVLKSVWHRLDIECLKNDDGTGPPIICSGEDQDGEDLIGCESRNNCPNEEFLHHSCAGVDPENIDTPWYCSIECRNRINPRYQYCICKMDLGTDELMIGFSAEDRCLKDDGTTCDALKLIRKRNTKGNGTVRKNEKLYVKVRKEREVRKINVQKKKIIKGLFSIAALWRGLNLLCRRDSVREADGESIMAFWKLDLIHFFGHKHPEYVMFAHRLLAAINGWVPERVKQDLIHNRTVNYDEGIGRNLPLDFMNEILNRLFKDLLESAKGRYKDTTINRCSQIVGPLGVALDVVFDTNVVENEIYRHRRRDVNRDANVANLIDVLYTEKLFSHIPGRKHSAFQDFNYNETPMQAAKFTSKMKQLSKKLDRRRAIVLDN